MKLSETPMDMTEDESSGIISYLKKSDIMLEYGCGSSTNYFSPHVREYHSIEHVKEWADLVREQKNSNVSIYHAPCHYINNNTHCDYTSDTEREKWRDYFTYTSTLNIQKFDKVLIDGRARAHVASDVMKYLTAESVVFIHDYMNRSKYHRTVESLYDVIDTKRTLFIGRPKVDLLNLISI